MHCWAEVEKYVNHFEQPSVYVCVCVSGFVAWLSVYVCCDYVLHGINMYGFVRIIFTSSVYACTFAGVYLFPKWLSIEFDVLFAGDWIKIQGLRISRSMQRFIENSFDWMKSNSLPVVTENLLESEQQKK